MNRQIKNLKDFVQVCGSHKSDIEISSMLDIPVKSVALERSKLSRSNDNPDYNIASINNRSPRIP